MEKYQCCEDTDELETLPTAGENAKWFRHCGKFGSSSRS